MNAKRIRQINVLELDQAMFNSTYRVGLELANWLNAKMHVCMLETKEQKEFVRSVYGMDESRSHLINRGQLEDIINSVKINGGLIDLGLSIEHFDEDDSVNDIFREISIDESFSVLGYNKSAKHKEVLKKLLKSDLGSPLMLVPMGREIENFHRIVVPFQPEYVTYEKLESLKWYADQLGVMIDFVHFKKKGESSEMMRFNEVYERVFDWIEELGFHADIKFRFPLANNLNEGLVSYLEGKNNFLLCVIDDYIKGCISTSRFNKECLTDIKEPVVIF